MDTDEHLRAALRHAPDADVAPPPELGARILAEARRATAGRPGAAPTQAPRRRGWLAGWGGWQLGASGAFASVLMAGVIGLMWRAGTPPPVVTVAEAPAAAAPAGPAPAPAFAPAPAPATAVTQAPAEAAPPSLPDARREVGETAQAVPDAKRAAPLSPPAGGNAEADRTRPALQRSRAEADAGMRRMAASPSAPPPSTHPALPSTVVAEATLPPAPAAVTADLARPPAAAPAPAATSPPPPAPAAALAARPNTMTRPSRPSAEPGQASKAATEPAPAESRQLPRAAPQGMAPMAAPREADTGATVALPADLQWRVDGRLHTAPPGWLMQMQLAVRAQGVWQNAPGATPQPGEQEVSWYGGGQVLGRLWLGRERVLWCTPENHCEQAALSAQAARDLLRRMTPL